MKLNLSVIQSIQDHAVNDYPNEACGFVLSEGYLPQVNISDTPDRTFKISARATKWAQKNGLLAVVHSHANGGHYPSENDMRGQRSTAVPWFICNVDDGVPTDFFGWGEPSNLNLVGRSFRHGVTDCYSIIRDWFFQNRKITLPDYPRGWDWWKEGGDLYSRFFADAGFAEVEPGDVRQGDVFLATIGSRVINHAGVYVGNGLILHQLSGKHGYAPDRLSCRVPVTPWLKHVNFWIRYHG